MKGRPDGKLVLVTAINPTPAGEGKTTTTIGLGDGLNRIGKRAVIALREPSLGPVFGTKGGATGGGKAQVLPMEAINLHFTGDFHAITSAHNLLAALVDNHVYWGNALGIDTRRIVWRRVLDMNDRALRAIVNGLGGAGNGYSREDGFDITVASEVMACFCLADDLADLEARLSRIVVAYTRDKKPVTAGQLNAAGAMTALLKDAIKPNLVQTIEGSPALIHGGPFANIAHGCNSVIATRTALKLGDYVVTEAGFGADLGAEKFFDIKCRKAGLKPDAAVVVATVRALKMNGGVAKADLARENLEALRAGIVNLGRHVENVRAFGVPVVVAINHFTTDTAAEHQLIADICRDEFGVEAVQCRHWADGAAGAEELARKVVALCEGGTCPFPAALSGQPVARGQDPLGRHPHLSRRRHRHRAQGRRRPQGLRGRGLWPPAGLHGEDAVFLLRRSEPARRADRTHRAGARGQALGRRRLRRGDLRGYHDHAGPAQAAGGRGDPCQRGRADRGAVLKGRSSCRTELRPSRLAPQDEGG